MAAVAGKREGDAGEDGKYDGGGDGMETLFRGDLLFFYWQYIQLQCTYITDHIILLINKYKIEFKPSHLRTVCN